MRHWHCQVRQLINRVEAEHGDPRRVIRHTLGYESMRTACATLKGFKVMRALKKGRAALWQ